MSDTGGPEDPEVARLREQLAAAERAAELRAELEAAQAHLQATEDEIAALAKETEEASKVELEEEDRPGVSDEAAQNTEQASTFSSESESHWGAPLGAAPLTRNKAIEEENRITFAEANPAQQGCAIVAVVFCLLMAVAIISTAVEGGFN